MGIVGLETAFPVLYTELVMKGFCSLDKLIDLICIAPRRRFGIDGSHDFAVFEISEPYHIDPDKFYSQGRSTPFSGRKVSGRCVLTVSNGKIVYKE